MSFNKTVAGSAIASFLVSSLLTVGVLWKQIPWTLQLATNYYCTQVPEKDRQELRKAVNKAIAPRSVVLDCADGEKTP